MSSHSWFSRALLPWYREHGRDLPWRRTRDPYRVWLSEVILQQTRVDQGLPYYERFAGRYPMVEDLAKARETDVRKLWQGLGYYDAKPTPTEHPQHSHKRQDECQPGVRRRDAQEPWR